MVDRELRRDLSLDLRRLVTGRMTNDDFDDAYYDRYCDAPDATVREIAEFGYGLYSSDTGWPYRLSGRHSLDPTVRRAAARCILFLRSELPYEWPEPPSARLAWGLWSLSWAGLATGIALLVISVLYLALASVDLDLFGSVAVLGLVLVLASGWYLQARGLHRAIVTSNAWRAWQATGDYDVWPFQQCEDFYQARRSHHLLGTTGAEGNNR